MSSKLRRAVYAGLLLTTVGLSRCPGVPGVKSYSGTPAPPGQEMPAPVPELSQQEIKDIVGKYDIKIDHVRTYIENHLDDALALEAKSGIPAAAALAKAGTEHSFGKNGELIAHANNHFGIKCSDQFRDQFPNCYDKVTWEEGAAGRYTTSAPFVMYPDARASYLHFGQYLKERRIGDTTPYAGVLSSTGSPRSFLRALADSRYSTNSQVYAATIRMLDRYHLEEIARDAKIAQQKKMRR